MPVRIKEASPFYEYGPITHGICQEWFFKEDVKTQKKEKKKKRKRCR